MIKINGESLEAAGKTIAEYLTTTDYVLTQIAIERNGEIVPRADYENVFLENGDELEIVSFVGGG